MSILDMILISESMLERFVTGKTPRVACRRPPFLLDIFYGQQSRINLGFCISICDIIEFISSRKLEVNHIVQLYHVLPEGLPLHKCLAALQALHCFL